MLNDIEHRSIMDQGRPDTLISCIPLPTRILWFKDSFKFRPYSSLVPLNIPATSTVSDVFFRQRSWRKPLDEEQRLADGLRRWKRECVCVCKLKTMLGSPHRTLESDVWGSK